MMFATGKIRPATFELKRVHINRWKTPGSSLGPDHPAFWEETPWYLRLLGYPARRHYCSATYSLDAVYMYEGHATTEPGYEGEHLEQTKFQGPPNWRPREQQTDPETPMSNEELKARALELRIKAEKIGPMHALWDLISDAEALADGKPTLATRQEIEQMLRQETP